MSYCTQNTHKLYRWNKRIQHQI